VFFRFIGGVFSAHRKRPRFSPSPEGEKCAAFFCRTVQAFSLEPVLFFLSPVSLV
jgi:hypothetical protein